MMTDVEFQDGGGAVMKLRDFEGRYGVRYTTREQWYRLKSLEIRDSDIFICSYPKSGTHWIWEIITMLKKGDASPVKDIMENHILDFGPGGRYDYLPLPRILTTHRYLDEMSDDVIKKRCKIVYLLRDPKDVCVSWYHHMIKQKNVGYQGEFKDFIQLFLEGKVLFNEWTQHILRWGRVKNDNSDLPILVVHYEDIQQFPHREIRRLVDFLEVEADDTLIRDIIANTNFALMKTKKESLHNPFNRVYRGGKDIMYRKGIVGDWRNWFPDGKQEEFNSYLTLALGGSNLGILNSVKRYLNHSRL